MKTRTTVGLALGFCGCGLAIGATIDRTGAGGVWSDTTKWSSMSLPTSADEARHGSSASGVFTLDENVDPEDRVIDTFTAVAGDSRGLIIDAGLDLSVETDFTRSSGTGPYVTELMDGSSLTVGGTIVEGDWIIGDGATVTADEITISENTDWEVNENGSVDVAGDINFVDVDPNTVSVFTVRDGGALTVGGSAFFESLSVYDSGSAVITGALDANDIVIIDGGTLSAGSAGTSGSSPCLGELWIRNGGTVDVDGELRVRSNSNIRDIIYYGAGSLTAGSLNFASSNSQLTALSFGQDLDASVSGDIDIVTSRSAGLTPFIQWRYVTLTLDGNSTQDVEVFTPEYDIDPNNPTIVWQGLTRCGDEHIYNVEPMAELIVESGATVELTDENVNILRGNYSQDALYVGGDVTVESGATLNLGSLKLIYTGTLDDSGTITGTTPAQVTKVCYGDFDADGDVDTGDFAIMQAAFSGANNASNNPLCSVNMDGDVDTQDFAVFQTQFTGPNQPCPTSCLESGGGGDPSIEDLADWCIEHLSSGERESFAEILYGLAEGAGETQDAADMAELAYLITLD